MINFERVGKVSCLTAVNPGVRWYSNRCHWALIERRVPTKPLRTMQTEWAFGRVVIGPTIDGRIGDEGFCGQTLIADRSGLSGDADLDPVISTILEFESDFGVYPKY